MLVPDGAGVDVAASRASGSALAGSGRSTDCTVTIAREGAAGSGAPSARTRSLSEAGAAFPVLVDGADALAEVEAWPGVVRAGDAESVGVFCHVGADAWFVAAGFALAGFVSAGFALACCEASSSEKAGPSGPGLRVALNSPGRPDAPLAGDAVDAGIAPGRKTALDCVGCMAHLF